MMLSELLREALAARASDLHLTNGAPPFLRIDGEIVLTSHPPLSPAVLTPAIHEILNPEQRRQLQETFQICFSLALDGIGYFRVNVYHQRGQIEAAIRLGSVEHRSLEDLGLPEVVVEFTRRPNGLVLVTGPTGVGKTTTFNAMIDRINRERRTKIITVEDPIEYIHQNVRSIVVQQELLTDTKSFSQALIHILRQDPDVIGIGEMRDLETISTALTAAETGHLVIATLHTSDASRTINRIIDVFPAHAQEQVRTQLAASLVGITSQLLLPRADQKGRVLATEVLVATEAVRNVIREDKIQTLPNVILTGQQYGMQLMDRSLVDLYQRGLIGYETAMAKARDQKYFRKCAGSQAS